MCRMIGFAASEPADARPYLDRLSGLSRNGNLVARWERRPGGNHPDGWGVAYRSEGEVRVMRSGLPANSDPAFSGIRLSTDRFIGHVRYASDPSTVNDGNSHPFLYSGIALAHNGTFRGAIGEEASRRKASDTLVFLERLSARWKERTIAGLKESLDEMLGDAGLVGDYSAANLLISCGESLFALRRCRRDEDYYTLYMRTAPGLAVAASEKLDGDPGWRLLENGELVDMRLPEPRFGHLRASA